jgi:hypothetical protein
MKRFALVAVSLLWSLGASGQELRPASKYEASLFSRRAWKECVQYFDDAVLSGADYTGIHFGAAECYANLGDHPAALIRLRAAVDHGFRGATVLRTHPAFQALSSDSRWTTLVADCQRNADRYDQSLNPELSRLFGEDQADRRPPINEALAMVRDETRRLRVIALVRASALVSAGDYFHAAFILQHSCLSEDYAMAHALADKAVALDPWDGGKRWLAAATRDRYLGSIGQAQIYGTQHIPIDGSAVSDEERLRMCVRPLLETLDAIDRMSGRPRRN